MRYLGKGDASVRKEEAKHEVFERTGRPLTARGMIELQLELEDERRRHEMTRESLECVYGRLREVLVILKRVLSGYDV